ncbi:RHS repeat domain-containing protein [Pseudomonas carnis]|uniref:RHS repeat domain-containing protein n=1 Tax=Pseudomonas carnis TaxID=2487355 RepID=UPI001E324004|nr:RHS domain-containing protein [Pseudomonas carnis]
MNRWPASMASPGSEVIFYFHTNLAGLPEQLTDTDGNTVWHSEYQAWGKSRDEWHDQQPGREQNLRFQGQYLDRETGLHYNTFRFLIRMWGGLPSQIRLGCWAG